MTREGTSCKVDIKFTRDTVISEREQMIKTTLSQVGMKDEIEARLDIDGDLGIELLE